MAMTRTGKVKPKLHPYNLKGEQIHVGQLVLHRSGKIGIALHVTGPNLSRVRVVSLSPLIGVWRFGKLNNRNNPRNGSHLELKRRTTTTINQSEFTTYWDVVHIKPFYGKITIEQEIDPNGNEDVCDE